MLPRLILNIMDQPTESLQATWTAVRTYPCIKRKARHKQQRQKLLGIVTDTTMRWLTTKHKALLELFKFLPMDKKHSCIHSQMGVVNH